MATHRRVHLWGDALTGRVGVTDKGFVLLAERVAFFIIEHALAELPTKETVRSCLHLQTQQ